LFENDGVAHLFITIHALTTRWPAACHNDLL
jgi:hypothetical protein